MSRFSDSNSCRILHPKAARELRMRCIHILELVREDSLDFIAVALSKYFWLLVGDLKRPVAALEPDSQRGLLRLY